MYTLGINAAYHDCSACLVSDGHVIAAAEEERFTRIKHGKRPVPFSTWQLPFHAIDYCLQEADIDLTDVAHIGYSYDPYLLLGPHADAASIQLPLRPSAHASAWQSPWDPLFLSYIVNAPRQLAGGVPHHLKRRFRGARHDGPYRWHFIEHHLAHEASAFLAAPFESCAVLTMDGRGEVATTSYGVYEDRRYRRIKQVNLPHSLGLLYEAVTDYLGFLHSSDEYKVMALASFGQPIYAPLFRDIVKYQGEGEYEVMPMQWEKLFGPARARGTELTQHHMDIARSLQLVLEETVLRMADWLQRETGAQNLCMAGGVALNCVMNAKVRESGKFSQGAAGRRRCRNGAGRGALDRFAAASPCSAALADGTCFSRTCIRRPGDRTIFEIHEIAISAGKRYRRSGSRFARTEQGTRMVPGTHGIRAARIGRALHPCVAGRCSHAKPSEPDQGPRRFPAGCAGGAGRGSRQLVRQWRYGTVHAVCV
jgi:tRNA A37 threonylcarbamoyltransferase TsaD